MKLIVLIITTILIFGKDIDFSKKSNIIYSVNSNGILAFNRASLSGEFYWPRNDDYLRYLFGAGLVFVGTKTVDGQEKEFLEYGYNPQYASTLLRPKYDENKPEDYFGVYNSTDYDQASGTNLSNTFYDWPAWENCDLIQNFNFVGSDYIIEESDRMINDDNIRPSFLTDEEFVVYMMIKVFLRLRGTLDQKTIWVYK